MWTDATRQTHRDQGGRNPNDLTDAQWATVAPPLTGDDPPTADRRKMIDACLYPEKAGCPGHYLPTDFGRWETVRTGHGRFRPGGIGTEIAAFPGTGPGAAVRRPAGPRSAAGA